MVGRLHVPRQFRQGVAVAFHPKLAPPKAMKGGLQSKLHAALHA